MSAEATRPTVAQRSRIGATSQSHSQPRRRPHGVLRRLILFAVMLACLAFAVPALTAAGIYGSIQIGGTIVPGVFVDDMSVEGLTLDQAVQQIDRNWNRQHALTLIDNTDPARQWQVSPAEIGLSVDAVGTAEQAFEIGRQPEILVALSSWYAAQTLPVRIHPIVRLDEGVAQAALERWADQTSIAPVDGYVRIEGEDLSFADGMNGKRLDLEATWEFLASSSDAIMTDYGVIPLIMRPVAPAIGSVSEATGEARRLMNASFTLRAYDAVTDEWFEWSPGLGIIAGWLEIERKDEGAAQAALGVELIQDRLRTYIERLNDSLGEDRAFDFDEALARANGGLAGEATDPILIHYRPTTREVGYGETWTSIGWKIGMPPWRIQDENPQIAGRNPLPGETINIPPKDANLALPIVAGKRIVISIPEQHMWTYENGELRSDHKVSTGIARSPTMAGVFQVQSHYENAYASNWDLWMPDFLGIYDALPGFTNGIHGLPTLSNGVRLWANVLGRPASYGCIILDLDAAHDLYTWAEDGVVVQIDSN